MKVLNINLHFFPESYGGATVVAEKLAYGLASNGHHVANLCLSLAGPSNIDFSYSETVFGGTFYLNGIEISARTRFSNPPASALIQQISELFDPDMVVLHAPQHLGIGELARNQKLLKKTVIVAHDFYWACLQGFRTLPSGARCSRQISSRSCRECAIFPGLIDTTYDTLLDALNDSKAVVFPSKFLHQGYKAIYGERLRKGRVIGNPDQGEMLLNHEASKKVHTGATGRRPTVGYFGGPGYEKGWDLVQHLAENPVLAGQMKERLVLFDAGATRGAPWYGLMKRRDNVEVRPGYHWTFAREVLGEIDVALVPSRVSESFGLVPREMLSIGKRAVVFGSGALDELKDYEGIFTADEKSFSSVVYSALTDSEVSGKKYTGKSAREYAEEIAKL